MSILQSFIVIISIILLGILFQRTKILNATQIEGFGIFLLKLAMPCYLFTSTLQHDLSTLLYTKYIFSFIFAFIIITGIVAILYKDLPSKASLCIKILAAGYPNAVIYTLPVITFLLKDPTAGILGNILQIVVIQTIFVAIFSFLRHKEHSLLKKLWVVVTTPLILAPVLGLICNYWDLTVHAIPLQIAQHIGNGASSIALFSFGLTIGEVQFNKQTFTRPLINLVVIKNLIHPIVAFCVGKFIFGLHGYWLHALIISSSAPTAFVVYLLSRQFQIEEDLIKKSVAISSIFSLGSLLIIAIYLSKYASI